MIFRSKSRRMDCSLNWSYINYGELRCDPVMIALKAMNFKLELVLLRIMWVFGHFFTCRLTWSQLETFNMIGVNVIRQKSSKVNGDGKKHRSVPEVFLAASPLVASASGQKCVGLQPTPKIPAARKKNLWYPGYQSGGILSNYTAHVSFSINHL